MWQHWCLFAKITKFVSENPDPMKKFYLLVTVLMILFSTAKAQVVELKFSATFNGNHTHFDSLKIRNYSHPGDTMLVWPDTSIIFGTVGIQDMSLQNDNRMQLTMLSANPCIDEAEILILLPSAGPVEIRFSDQSGKLLCSRQENLAKGGHRFSVRSMLKGIGIISVVSGNETKSLKLIFSGSENGRDAIAYLGKYNSSPNPKSQAEVQTFTFAPGDFLGYTCFRDGDSLLEFATPFTSSAYSFNFTGPYTCPMFVVYGGMTYHTVVVGTQCWLAENLNIGTMVNGMMEMTNDGVIEKYCYNNDTAMCSVYGGLYQWWEVMQYDSTPYAQGICPPDFHVPADIEWGVLVDSIGGNTFGGNLKETGFTHWNSPNLGATNSTGFTALGGGRRLDVGTSYGLKDSAYFWTSTSISGGYSAGRSLSFNSSNVMINNMPRTFGWSVRCLFNY
jgi:uncharacterized protein (TIGR02145 family)